MCVCLCVCNTWQEFKGQGAMFQPFIWGGGQHWNSVPVLWVGNLWVLTHSCEVKSSYLLHLLSAAKEVWTVLPYATQVWFPDWPAHIWQFNWSPPTSKSANQMRANQMRAKIRAKTGTSMPPVIPCWHHKCFHLGAIVTASVAHCWHSDVLT